MSRDCRDLLQRLLERDPDARLTFSQFFSHPFVDLEHMPSADSLGKAVRERNGYSRVGRNVTKSGCYFPEFPVSFCRKRWSSRLSRKTKQGRGPRPCLSTAALWSTLSQPFTVRHHQPLSLPNISARHFNCSLPKLQPKTNPFSSSQTRQTDCAKTP